MTTHLVIADVPTLNRIMRSDRIEVVRDDTVPLGGWLPWVHRETGDTWLFRTPETVKTTPSVADIVYRTGYHFNVASRSILPLIAACDLLGIEEL